MIELLIRMLPAAHFGQKTRPCPELEIITLRTLMINQAREVFCQRRFPASLIYVLIVSPPPAVPSILMPLPSRSTSAGLPVVLDTALLPCSPLGAKETKFEAWRRWAAREESLPRTKLSLAADGCVARPVSLGTTGKRSTCVCPQSILNHTSCTRKL